DALIAGGGGGGAFGAPRRRQEREPVETARADEGAGGGRRREGRGGRRARARRRRRRGCRARRRRGGRADATAKEERGEEQPEYANGVSSSREVLPEPLDRRDPGLLGGGRVVAVGIGVVVERVVHAGIHRDLDGDARLLELRLHVGRGAGDARVLLGVDGGDRGLRLREVGE